MSRSADQVGTMGGDTFACMHDDGDDDGTYYQQRMTRAQTIHAAG